jgi:hypothetical protein
MNKIVLCLSAAILAVNVMVAAPARASGEDDIFIRCGKKDANGNYVIPPQKLHALASLLTNPELGQYDKDCKGYLSAAEKVQERTKLQNLATSRYNDLVRIAAKSAENPKKPADLPADTARTALGMDQDSSDPGFYVRTPTLLPHSTIRCRPATGRTAQSSATRATIRTTTPSSPAPAP